MRGKVLRSCLVLALMALAPIASMAQNRKGDNEIRVSYGGIVSMSYQFTYLGGYDNSIHSFLISNLGDPQDIRTSGMVSLSYIRFLNDWLSVGGNVGTAFFHTDFENNYSHIQASSRWTHGVVSVLAGVRFHFLNKEWVRLYADVYAGMNMMYGKNPSTLYTGFAFQTCPFGISVGKKVSGFLELDFGSVYNGGNIGISVKF